MCPRLLQGVFKLTPNDEGKDLDVGGLYSVLKRRGYFWPSFEIYGGVAGFVDLGPLGSLLRENIESIWKEKFLLQEGFHLIDCPSINPEMVFVASGHLEKFSDLLVRCTGCLLSFRADHLLEDVIENADALSREDLASELKERDIRCPECSSELGDPEDFNLMFSTFIGPGKEKRAYLRPETAQSIFMDFNHLYRFNRDRMPFGVAQIGKGFRNEISPRQGMLRLREFHMAEGEFFFDPDNSSYHRTETYRDLQVDLLANSDPETTIHTTLGKATEDGIIGSDVLAHFLGVTHSFATSIGIPREGMRFRQHLRSEMAHYARECWDLEVITSSGWVEMVGVADRSAYDLSQHAKASGVELKARRRFDDPIVKDISRLQPKMKELGPIFKGDAKKIGEGLEGLDIEDMKDRISSGAPITVMLDGVEVEVPSNCYELVEGQERIHVEPFTPNVIEPSFGIDRLMVSVLEHAYNETGSSPMGDGSEDGTYRVLRLDPKVAPIKVGVFPLLNKDDLPELASPLNEELRKRGINTYYDVSGSIGRRYARMDEIGTPFCITIDHQSRSDGNATLRKRDTGEQVRIKLDRMVEVIDDLCRGRVTFDEL